MSCKGEDAQRERPRRVKSISYECHTGQEVVKKRKS